MSASNTPEIEQLKSIYEKNIEFVRKEDSISGNTYNSIIEYVEALEKFKEDIENEQLLSKKYRVITPYSNYPCEDSIQFYYSAESFNESNFTQKDLKKIKHTDVLNLYMKDPELYNYLGHHQNWVCEEGGAGHWEKHFNEGYFRNMVVQHSSIVSDFIKSDIKIKLSLIK